MSVEDRAQEQEALEWERNNQVRKQKTYAAGDAGYGPADCLACGEPMPELRRIDGRTHCTVCQSAIEQRIERRMRWLR
jgi:RNA polymerase-binding transcription factor DksA